MSSGASPAYFMEDFLQKTALVYLETLKVVKSDGTETVYQDLRTLIDAVVNDPDIDSLNIISSTAVTNLVITNKSLLQR